MIVFKIIKKSMLVLSCAFIFSAHAMNENNSIEHIYIGGKLGWVHAQDACGSNTTCDNDSLGYGAYIGYQTLPWLALELGANNYEQWSAHYSSGSSEVKSWDAQIAAKLSYTIYGNLDVYTRLGASYASIDKDSLSSTQRSWEPVTALGLEYYLTNSISVRGEYQFINDFGNHTTNKTDLHFTSIGLTYHFGQSKSQAITTAPVADSEVPTETSKMVTLSSETTSSLFGFDSAALSNPSELDSVIKQIQKNENGVIVIGYTDNQGNKIYNQTLSERRAQTVKDYLVTQGIERSRIQMKGMGSQNPIASNKTLEGRSKNRRVTITYDQESN